MKDYLRFPRNGILLAVVGGLAVFSFIGVISTATYKIYWGTILSAILLLIILVLLFLAIKLDSIYMDSSGIIYRKNKYLWDEFFDIQITQIDKVSYKIVLFLNSKKIVIINSLSILSYMLKFCKTNDIIISALKKEII